MQLSHHSDPIVRFLYRTLALGEDPRAEELRKLQAEIPGSPRVQALLSDRDAQGRIPFHPYSKWQGAHWVLTMLADCGYPPGDASLQPLREQVFEWLLSPEHLNEIRERTGKLSQVRLHASMEANALFSALALGQEDGRTAELAERLLWAQWPDGGWNCDQKAKADTSSFHETITPLRALNLYARRSGDGRARAAAERGAEVFLTRRLYKRLRDGEVIRPQFTRLHKPAFWHYDILIGLKVMAECGLIGDPRCQDALDLLESKRLPDGAFPAESKHYSVNRKPGERIHGSCRADWGPGGAQSPNEFVTIDALYILRAAGKSVALTL